MIVFFFGVTAVMLVAMLSRDHDITASQETVVTAELHLGESAVVAFPDRVHLSRRPLHEFEFHERVTAAREALSQEGFASAGSYALDELPGVGVLLMTNRRQAMSATVYEHVRAGAWVEVVSSYADGTRVRHTTLDGSGLDTRPENTLVALPGACIAELLARARGDRPVVGLERPTRDDAVARFEADYAAWVSARKRRAREAGFGSEESSEDRRLPRAA